MNSTVLSYKYWPNLMLVDACADLQVVLQDIKDEIERRKMREKCFIKDPRDDWKEIKVPIHHKEQDPMMKAFQESLRKNMYEQKEQELKEKYEEVVIDLKRKIQAKDSIIQEYARVNKEQDKKLSEIQYIREKYNKLWDFVILHDKKRLDKV